MTVRLTLRSVLLLAMVALVLLTVAVFTVIVFESRRAAMFSNADNLMRTGAAFAEEWLGPHYHERITDRHSVSPADFERIVARHDQLCQKLGLQYIWSLLELDGQLVFTTATHTVLTNQHSACAAFFDVHTNPEVYRHALATMQPEFTTFHDKWGAGRMVLLPAWDKQHRKYLFAASVQLAGFDALLRRTLLESIVVGLAVGGLFSLLAWMLARMLTRPLTRLVAAIERMGQGDLHGAIERGPVHEVRALADAFAAMRGAMQQKVAALHESEERYRGLVESLGLGVSLISPRMEVLALNRQMREWNPDLPVEGRPLCFQAFNSPPRTAVCEYCPVVRTLQDGEPHEAVTSTPHGDRVINYRIKSAPVKDAAGRITAVIETVEDITERKRIEDALIQSEANLLAVTNSTPDLIFSVDARNFRVLHSNAAHVAEIKRVYGIELRPGMTAREILPTPELWALWEGLFQRALAEGRLENEYLRPQDQRSFSVSINPIYHDQRVASLSVFIHDITARKRAEAELVASEDRLRAFLNNSAVIGWMKDEAGRYVFLSDNYSHRIGVRREDILGRTDAELWSRPVADEFVRNDRAVLEGGQSIEVIEQAPNPDGSMSSWLNSKFVFQDAAGKRYVGGLGVDITARQQAEEQLRASEERYRLLAEHTEDFVSVHDAQDQRLYVSPSFYRATGWTSADLEHSPWDARLHPDDLPLLQQSRAANRAGQSTLIEYRVRCRDGSWLWVEARCRPVMDPQGQMQQLVIWAREITERKAAALALSESQAQLAAVLESTQDMICSVEAATLKVLSFNPAFAQEILQGYGVRLVPNMSLRELASPDKTQGWEQLVQRALREGRFTDESFRAAEGRYFERTFNPIIKAGQPDTVALFAKDITARKKAEIAFAESEHRLRAFLENSAVIAWMKDDEDRLVYVSDNLLRRFKGQREEWLGKTGFEIWPRPMAENIQGYDREVRGGGSPHEVIEQVPNPDGSFSWFLKSRFTYQDSTGKQFVGGLGVDITERKAAEEALRLSQAQLTAVLESTQDMIWSVDAQTFAVLEFNPALARFVQQRFGITLRPGLTAREILPADRYGFWAEQLERTVREGSRTVEYELPGSPIHLEVVFNPILTEGRVVALAIFAKDIAARKQAEEALRQSEEKYRALVETTNTGCLVLDVRGQILDANPEYVRLTGHDTLEEIRGRTVVEWTAPHDRENNARAWERCLAQGYVRNLEVDHVDRHGHILPVEINATVVGSGAATRVLALCRDITARKQAAAALRQSEEKYRALVETTNTGFLILDAQGKIIDANEEYVRLTGHAALAEIVGRSVVEWTAPHDRERNAREVALCLARGFVRNLEFDYIDPQGKLTPIDCNATVVSLDGAPRVLALCRDITARRQAAEALREAQAHLASVVESTEDLIWSVDALSLELLSFNSAFAAEIFCTYAVRVEPGMSLRDFVPADRIPTWEALLRQAIREGRFTDTFFRSNKPKWFERTFNPIVKAGQAVGVSIFARDVTERRLAELALRESEEKFSRLATHIEDVLYSVDAATREFRYLNPSFQKMFG